MATIYEEDFEGISAGSNITTSNTAFTFVSATPPVATATAMHGTSAMECNTSASLQYANFAHSTLNVVYRRIYVRWPTLPGANSFFWGTNGAAAAIRAQVRILSTNLLQMRNGTVAVWSSTMAMSANTWYRLEWKTDFTNSQQQFRIFTGANIEGSTPDEDSGNQTFNTGTMVETQVGVIASATMNIIIDDAKDDDTTWVGPVGGGPADPWTYHKAVRIGT